MSKAQIIVHKGKNVVYIDLTNAVPEETLNLLPQAKKIIASQAMGSALVLTNVTNASYNSKVADSIKDFTSFNKPYVKASAVIGVDGIRMVLYNTILFLTRREIKAFNTQIEALDWLVSQG